MLGLQPGVHRGAFDRWVEGVTLGIEAAGIAIVLGGALLASAWFVRRLREQPFAAAYRAYRADLGRAILLGLELLVAADIIGTVAVEPTFRSLGVLAAIVLIRTFLSFALEVEINGHWPWQASKYERPPGEATEAPDRL